MHTKFIRVLTRVALTFYSSITSGKGLHISVLNALLYIFCLLRHSSLFFLENWFLSVVCKGCRRVYVYLLDEKWLSGSLHENLIKLMLLLHGHHHNHPHNHHHCHHHHYVLLVPKLLLFGDRVSIVHIWNNWYNII